MKKCVICGKEFEHGYARSKKDKEERFCSLECRARYNAGLQSHLRKIKCSSCGKEFEIPLSSTKTVCFECKQREKERLRYLEIPQVCEVCGKEFNYDWRKDPSVRKSKPLKYCSLSCNNKASSREKKGKQKEGTCSICGQKYLAPIVVSSKAKCPVCRQEYRLSKGGLVKKLLYRYKYDKDTLLGKFERSGFYIQKSPNLARLGFSFDNPNLEEEFLKVQKLLITEYEINLKSADQIEKEYELTQNILTLKILSLFNIDKRKASEATSLSLYKGISQPHSDPKFQHGFHTDWENKDHYLRSSYEFDLAEKLDMRHIHYETEVIRIRYFDSQNGVYKTGVPDFYLPDFNLIIETKSSHFYSPVDLTDRKAELERLGFRFYVLLDREKILEEFKPLDQLDCYLALDQFLEKQFNMH